MAGKITIKYFGNSAFLITTEKGRKVLIDPCLTGVEGRGVTRFRPEDIESVDAIFVTHAAWDHLGDAYEIAARTRCFVLGDPATVWYLKTKGLPMDRVKGTGWGMRGEVAGVRFQTVESRHLSMLRLPDVPPITGNPNGYIIYTESGRGIYHPGDTSIFRDAELFGELYHPEIGLLGIGGFPGFSAELTPKEAALMVKWMKLKTVIPHHYPPGGPEAGELAAALKKQSPETKTIALGHGDEVVL
ncbi:MAG: MBL fold metallo-hydrolase [Chloroflexi bacterium]|nr:MBL fold metallo-hydrolase [Chloroflexota bacterium]